MIYKASGKHLGHREHLGARAASWRASFLNKMTLARDPNRQVLLPIYILCLHKRRKRRKEDLEEKLEGELEQLEDKLEKEPEELDDGLEE